MKLKFSAILGFAFVSVLFLSCDKEKDSVQTCKIVKEGWIHGSDTSKFIFSYNSDRKLTRSQFDESFYTTYNWEANRVTGKNFENNVLKSTEIATLNSKGQAVSSTRTLAGAVGPKSTTMYEYDDDGYLISKITTSATDANDIETDTYDYEDGNLVLQTYEHVKVDYNYYSETSHEYYTDKVNTYDLSAGIYGKVSKNLVKKSTLNAIEPVSLTVLTTYTYEMERNGNVKSKTVTISGNSTKIVPTYECK
jgi:hypothetical protein